MAETAESAEPLDISHESAAWLQARSDFFASFAHLQQHDQLDFFDFMAAQGDGFPAIRDAICERGKITQQQADDTMERLREMFSSRLTDNVRLAEAMNESPEWRGQLTTFALAEARWRIPIEQALQCAQEVAQTAVGRDTALHYGTGDEIARPRQMPLAADEPIIWVTKAACSEIAHAISGAAPALLAADMFPVPAATVVFHMPIHTGSLASCGTLRWKFDIYDDQPVVWLTTMSPSLYSKHTAFKYVTCIPLGYLGDEFFDFPLIQQPDRLLWATLQIAQTPLAQRPKSERAAVRRSDRRADSRGGEQAGPRLKVIDLRRPRRGDPVDPAERHMHAHWVQGHMRNHWWPSLEQHVPRWIQAHVRGNVELGWAPGHSPDGPPPRNVVYRVQGDWQQ